MNSQLLNLYEINKNGFISIDKKACVCGEIVDVNVDVCPKCQQSLSKTKLLNVNKNNALKKRTVVLDENGVFSFNIYGLFSKGFDLYEQELLKVSFDRNTEKVLISDTKYFKANGDSDQFREELDKAFPGFCSFVLAGLKEQEYEYAVTRLSSLRSDQFENFFHVYNQYRALIPYLRGYKVLNYGKNIALKDIFPSTDFNDEESVKKLPIYLPALLTYDFKNVRYIDTLVEIYKTKTDKELLIFNNCVDKMLDIMNRRGINGDELFDTFSVLYNKDISFEDFIRIFLVSREDYFGKMMNVKKMLKKVYGKFSWSDIEKIDRKLYGTLETKTELRNVKISKDKIEEVFSTLENDPMKALDILIAR